MVSILTIGELNAGAGNVTVQSLNGVILDGNGAALNVIAGTATLSGAGRTARENELDEEFKVAAAAAAGAQAAAEQTAADALGDGKAIIDAEVASDTSRSPGNLTPWAASTRFEWASDRVGMGAYGSGP